MSNQKSLFAFGLILITTMRMPSVTSLFYGFEDDPPPDSKPCWISGFDLPYFTPGYIRLMCMPSTQTIIFDNGVLSELPKVFEKYPELVTFSAEQCNVERIHDDTFKGAHQLRFLYLSNNNIKKLLRYSFSPATRLYKLEISNSNVKTLEPNTFDSLAELVYLELSDNHITELPLGIFDPLIALRTLVLSNNAITRVESTLFLQNPFLSFVYLDANNLASVGKYSFVKTSVQLLNLAHNPDLGSLDLSWEILANLTTLKVSNTGLQKIVIPPNADTVVADNNKIDTVVAAQSDMPSKLTRLVLAVNRMRSIDRLFVFQQLDWLDLSDNNLESIDSSLNLPKLTKLAIARNLFTRRLNTAMLKRQFPMLKYLMLSIGKWDREYLQKLEYELKALDISMLEDFYGRTAKNLTSTPVASFDAKEFEQIIKKMHDSYTEIENKMTIVHKEHNRHAQKSINVIERNYSVNEHVKHMQYWLYGLFMSTSIAFIILISVFCGLGELKKWFLRSLPSRRATTQTHERRNIQ